MIEIAPHPIFSHCRFVARMIAIVLAAAFVDGITLEAAAIGYHDLEALGWPDASLNAALVITGNGQIHPRALQSSKVFTVFYALPGVISFVTVIGMLLTQVLQRMLHGFRSRGRNRIEKNEPQTIGTGECHSVSVGGSL